MIHDEQTNFLYLADTLQLRYPAFYDRLEMTLQDCGLEYALLPQTRDVWAVDYMPIQVDTDRFVSFRYEPPYLMEQAANSNLISNGREICRQLGIIPSLSDIILDGGNVVRCSNRVIMTKQVIKNNPHYNPKKLLSTLHELLEADHIHLIPAQPYDFTGHADGMVRFLDDHTLLINDYQKESPTFQQAFRTAIHQTGLEAIPIPYNVYDNLSNDQANGDYINYLHMANTIILPAFGLPEDELVVKQVEGLFPGHRIATLESNEIADDGGVLNCVSWNVRRIRH